MSGSTQNSWIDDLTQAARRWWAAPFSVVPSTSAPALMALTLAIKERCAAARLSLSVSGPIYNAPPSHALLLQIQGAICALAPRFVCRDLAVLLNGHRQYDCAHIYSYDPKDFSLSAHPMATLPGLHACDYSVAGNAALNTFLLDCRYWLGAFKYVDVSGYCTWLRRHEYSLSSDDRPAGSNYDVHTPTDGWFTFDTPQTESGTRYSLYYGPDDPFFSEGLYSTETRSGTLFSGAVLQNPAPLDCKIAILNCSPLYFNIGSQSELETVRDSSTTPPTITHYALFYDVWHGREFRDADCDSHYSDYTHETRQDSRAGSDFYIDTWTPTNKMQWRTGTRQTEPAAWHTVANELHESWQFIEPQPNWATGWHNVAARSKLEIPALSVHPGYPAGQLPAVRTAPFPREGESRTSSGLEWSANFTAHAVADYSKGFAFTINEEDENE